MGKILKIRVPGLFRSCNHFSAAWVLLATVLLFGLLRSLPHLYPPDTATVVVDMNASSGYEIALFLNDWSRPPFEQAIVHGRRHVYVFSGIAEDITLFRLDPTDAKSADVHLYSVQVLDSKGLIRTYRRAELANWRQANQKPLPSDDEAFHLLSTSDDPMMVASDKIVLRRKGPVIISKLVTRLEIPDLRDVVVLAFALLWVAALLDRDRCLHLPMSILILGSLWIVMPPILRSVHSLDPIDKAVGRASFFALSTKAGHIATLGTAAVSCLIAIAARSLAQLFWSRTPSIRTHLSVLRPSELPNRAASNNRHTKSLLLLIALIGLMCLPDVREVAESTLHKSFSQQWDLSGMTYWSYLIHCGYVPNKDFWYPYAGFYVFDLPLPFGVLFRWFYESIVYSIFFYLFYRISNRHFSLPLLATLIAIVGERLWIFPNELRYLLGILVFLSYLIIDRGGRKLTPSLIVFWLVVDLSFFFEPMQLVYGGVAIVVKLLIDVLQSRAQISKVFLSRMRRDFAVPLILAVLMVIWFAATGRLAGLVELYAHAADSAAYSAVPADLKSSLSHWMDVHLPQISLAGAPILIGIGLFERLHKPGISNYFADGLLGLGVVYFMVMQKDVIRPMGAEFCFLYLMAGLLTYAVAWEGRRRIVDYGAFIVILAVLGSFVIHNGGDDLWTSVSKAPHRVVDNLHLLFSQREVVRSANRSRFALDHFDQFSEERTLAKRISTLSSGSKNSEVFALTDDPVLYILTGQSRPVYFPNLYNASPIYDQERIVSWIEQSKVPFVVFDPDALEFDQFQRVVRSPLVFNAVTENYVPADTVGRFQILRRMKGGEVPTMAYWREKLGWETDFGHLPQISARRQLEPCGTRQHTSCMEFLEIRFSVFPTSITKLTVPVSIDGATYQIAFDTSRRQRDYRIWLDRFWPWETARKAGLSRKVLTDQLPSLVTAVVIQGAVPEHILY